MQLEGKKPVEAKRVGSALIVAFRMSQPRLVWRFDLEKNHSFSLALEGEEGTWELGVTSPKGEFYPVARFAAREDADQAFAAVQRALMTRKSAWLGWLLKAVGVLALFFMLAAAVAIFTLSRLGFMGMAGMPNPYAAAGMAAVPAAPVSVPQNGVPLPADQVLRPPP